MSRLIFFAAISLLCWQVDPPPEDVQAEAQSLLQHARQKSDIRSPGSPAFRLKATFSFIGDDLQTITGTYTETWVSDSQWRRETLIGDSRRIEVGGSAKHWLIDPDGFPQRASHLPTLMTASPPDPAGLAFASIDEHTTATLTADCVSTKPDAGKLHAILCFEKKSGLMLEKILPQKRPRNIVAFTCDYRSFRKFGAYVFPHEVTCFEDRHKIISANVVELSLDSPADSTLFEAPAGAIELGDCSGKSTPPTLPERDFIVPEGDRDRVSWIRIWFVVDPKGQPQHVKILRSPEKGTYDKALDKVRTWQFTPGTCDGKPISMPITMEIPLTPH